MTRDAHANHLREAATAAVHRLRLHAWNAGLRGVTDSEAETAAAAEFVAKIDALAQFAGLTDDEAELEFDGAPGTREQVTTPKDVWFL